MDPVKEPACVVCGATANVWGGPGSWVCADGNGCLARARNGFRAESTDPEVVAAAERLFAAADTKSVDALLDDAWTDRNEEHEPAPYIDMQRACSRCGNLQNVYKLFRGWQCDFCLGGDVMPDYEALGYPETACGNARLDEIAWLVGYLQRAHRAITEKDIPVATDIVDSDDTDSYNKDIRRRRDEPQPPTKTSEEYDNE